MTGGGYHVVAVELRRFSLERYKGYAQRADVELAPLTILVGPNNSGKTALAQAIQLLAGGLAPPDGEAREPLPLESGGLRHGETFEDLVTGRPVHGQLQLSITLAGEGGESSLSATVRNVVAPGQTPERQISDWRLQSNGDEMAAERQGFGESSDYRISQPGKQRPVRPVVWRGLLPKQPHPFAPSIDPKVDALRTWAAGVRHIDGVSARRPPRELPGRGRRCGRDRAHRAWSRPGSAPSTTACRRAAWSPAARARPGSAGRATGRRPPRG